MCSRAWRTTLAALQRGSGKGLRGQRCGQLCRAPPSGCCEVGVAGVGAPAKALVGVSAVSGVTAPLCASVSFLSHSSRAGPLGTALTQPALPCLAECGCQVVNR